MFCLLKFLHVTYLSTTLVSSTKLIYLFINQKCKHLYWQTLNPQIFENNFGMLVCNGFFRKFKKIKFNCS